MDKIVVLTGAGMSAESGIKTFRDADGLWENHRIEEVATPEGFRNDPALVLKFYNDRRRQLFEVEPNVGHTALVELEKIYKVTVITQNVDDLHERAGSTKVIHLHGELRKSRSSLNPNLIYDCQDDINLGDKAGDGSQLRPQIVWFGEDVPMIQYAAEAVSEAKIVIVVGSSMQVYPAAGLVSFAHGKADIYYVDPKPALNYELMQRKNLTVIAEPATTGVRKVVDKLLKD
jgi:NAD-dependent deacetylase